MTPSEQRIGAIQLAAYRPDIVLNHDMAHASNTFLKRDCGGKCLVVDQLAAALPSNKSFDRYDLVISPLPNLVARFCCRGVRAEFNRLAFEPCPDDARPAQARHQGTQIALRYVVRYTRLAV
jgi:hypothetical protein